MKIKAIAFRGKFLAAIIGLLFISIGVQGQVGQWTRPNRSYGNVQYRIAPEKTQLFPTGCGAPTLNVDDSSMRMAAIYLDSCAHLNYFYDPSLKNWTPASGAFYVAVDTIYKNAAADSIVYQKNGNRYAFKDSIGDAAISRTYFTFHAPTVVSPTSRPDSFDVFPNAWGIYGNHDISPDSVFIGTTDNFDVAGRRNNIEALRIGETNTSLGVSAMPPTNTANYTTAVGGGALAQLTSGNYNTAVGYTALTNNTSGNNNTAVGLNAMQGTTTGYANTAVGLNSQHTNVTGLSNTTVGYYADVATSSTNNAVAVGNNAVSATEGVAIGRNATAAFQELGISDSIKQIKMNGLGGTTGDVLSWVGGVWVAAPGGGGGGTNIYNTDGTLTASREVDLDNNPLQFWYDQTGSGVKAISLDPTAGMELYSANGGNIISIKNDSTVITANGLHSSDTAVYKPLAGSSSGGVVVMDHWPVGGGGGGSPAGNYGNIQINRNGLFDTPAGDSLNWRTGNGLEVLGDIKTDVQVITPKITTSGTPLNIDNANLMTTIGDAFGGGSGTKIVIDDGTATMQITATNGITFTGAAISFSEQIVNNNVDLSGGTFNATTGGIYQIQTGDAINAFNLPDAATVPGQSFSIILKTGATVSSITATAGTIYDKTGGTLSTLIVGQRILKSNGVNYYEF